MSVLGFLLHKDIKYDTLDKKFQYYQENRDEYAELKRMLKGFVVENTFSFIWSTILFDFLVGERHTQLL